MSADVGGDTARQLVVVGNTHFYFHPDADHIRLLQSVISLTLLEDTVRYWQGEGCTVSVVFCGDLNSTPDTGVYQLATEGYVKDTHHGWSGNVEEKIEGVNFEHDIPLASACGTPKYTNYTKDFNGCLDWIFYQTDRFDVKKVKKK